MHLLESSMEETKVEVQYQILGIIKTLDFCKNKYNINLNFFFPYLKQKKPEYTCNGMRR